MGGAWLLDYNLIWGKKVPTGNRKLRGSGRNSRASNEYMSGGCSEAAHSCPSAQWYVNSVALPKTAHVSTAAICAQTSRASLFSRTRHVPVVTCQPVDEVTQPMYETVSVMGTLEALAVVLVKMTT